MKFEITFEITRTYIRDEVIEAATWEDAVAIGERLLDNMDFVDMLDEFAEYEEREVDLCNVGVYDGKVTLTEDDVNDYLEEE